MPAAMDRDQASAGAALHRTLAGVVPHPVWRKMLNLGAETSPTLIIKEVKGRRNFFGLRSVIVLARGQLFHIGHHGLKEV